METINMCSGECLRQISETEYKSINCSNIIKCAPKLCENFNLCKHQLPKDMSRCMNCDILLGEWDGGKGKLNEYTNTECPICYEITLCFEQPRCNHTICGECFRTIYFGEPSDELLEKNIGKEPIFPYEDILNNSNMDYCDFDDVTYPLVIEYNIQNQLYCEKRDDFIERICTEKCGLCRK